MNLFIWNVEVERLFCLKSTVCFSNQRPYRKEMRICDVLAFAHSHVGMLNH